MENKKIGIIGYWFATNYGGVASYYSLYRCMKEWGYHPFFIENPYYFTDKEGVDVFSRNFFKEINADICEPYDIDNLTNLNEKADIFVLGSDQVLTSASVKSFGKLFLMEFADDSKRKIAFSASLGGDNLEGKEELITHVKKQLSRFQKISIREFAGLDIVRNKLGIKADFMIDPIFLTKAETYRQLGEQGKKNEGPYLLAYILDPTEDKRKGILKLSSILNIPIKIILDGRKYTHKKNADAMGLPEDTLPELDFNQWMYYYTNASYVITDSFHGTAMALILNKPVITYANFKRGYPRFLTLNKLFGIQDRLIRQSEKITETLANSVIDFEQINQILFEYYNKAKEWFISGTEENPGKNIEMPKSTVNALLEKEKCVGCGACVNTCPKDAIFLTRDDWGYYRAEVNVDLCIDCGKCSSICPAIKLPENRNSKDPECYEFIASDEKILMNSSSGGFFSIVAKLVFQNGGFVAGAAWDRNFSVEHILINDINELYKLQKSKYLQSYIGHIFRKIKEKLDENQEILFSGCPCQVAGLYAYLGKRYDNLFTIDLLCGNAPSSLFFQKYLREAFPEGIKKYVFREKAQGYNADCISVEKINGENVILRGIKEDAYQRVYHNHTMCASHCENCQYQRLPRFGDLTIGDFWGISSKDTSIDVRKGISVVLCNSENGKKLLSRIDAKEYKVFKKVPLEWLGGNGFAIKNSHNYASSGRDLFYDAIRKMSFSKAVNYALKPNHGIYNDLYKNVNAPLMLNSELTKFSFDCNVWEEYRVDEKITLHVRPNQWKVKRYANLSLAKPLVKGKKYLFDIRFRIKSKSPVINFHIKDSGSGCIQVIAAFQIPSNNNGSIWYEIKKEFIPDTDLYDQFMIGASQVSGDGNYFMIDYINIKED